MDSFGVRLIKARRTRGLSQAQLGKAAKLDPSLVSHFENDRRAPSLHNLRQLCVGLNCSADYLLATSPTMNTLVPTKLGRLTQRDINLVDGFVELLQKNAQRSEGG